MSQSILVQYHINIAKQILNLTEWANLSYSRDFRNISESYKEEQHQLGQVQG